MRFASGLGWRTDGRLRPKTRPDLLRMVSPPDISPATTAVTTSRGSDPTITARAEIVAKELGCPMLRRGGLSIAEVRDSTGRENLIVVTTEQVRLVAGGSVFWFHPNMARSRIEAMLRSEYDRLVEFAGVTTGDRVFDATGGLGSDAIVFAHAAGQSGHVCAVERSEILSAIVRHGSRYYEHRNREVIKAMRRVTFTCDDSSELLKTEADRTWDVVYFDPMFDVTYKTSQGLDLVRRLASLEPVRPGVIDQACRVARRCVVMKDREEGERLKALGFRDISQRGKLAYGRITM